VRHRSEVFLILAVSVFALTGVVAWRLTVVPQVQWEPMIEPVTVVQPAPAVQPTPTVQPTDDPGAWFQSIRMHCNPVDVETHMRWQPAPGSAEGEMHKAACYALAGRIDLARGVIEGLPEARRYQAAGVVFNIGHPAADAGDELAAGPLMELVVEFWPNHYMALYHAGAAAFERAEYGPAGEYLERFLMEYGAEDGWRTSALSMLETMTKISG
jgi:hypothetical protein